MTTSPSAGADVIQGASITTTTLTATSPAGVGRIGFAFSGGTSPPLPFYDYPAAATAPANTVVTVAATTAPGPITLKAIVTDRAGRTAATAVSTFNVVANAAPQITRFDVTPSLLQTYAGHPIFIDAAASDDLAVTSLDLSATAGFAVTRQAPVVNGAAMTRSFSVDVPPTTSGGATVDLILSASDCFPNRAATTQTKLVTILRATIGGGANIPMIPDPSVTNGWTVDAAVPSVDGTVTVAEDVVVHATDYASNPGSATRSINIHPVFDPNGATVSWLCPSAGALFPTGYNAKLRVLAVPATPDNGVTSVVFYVGSSQTPVTANAVGNNTYEVTTAMPAGSDGTAVPLRAVVTTIRNNKTDVRITVSLVAGSQVSGITAILDGDARFEGQTLIATGGTTTIDGPHTFARLIVLDGATVTHSAADIGGSKSLNLQVTGAVYVSCGGTIDAAGKGYQDAVNGYGRTWPNTTTGGSYQSSAGSHGGEGGHGGEAYAAAYGSIIDPNEPGGAGGHGGNYTGNQGGGIIRIHGATSIVVDGTIAADGLYAGQGGSGAGAGGSIRLDASTIGGAGSIHANGASGGSFNYGGGGGRIALYFQGLTMPRTSISTSGGDSTPGGGASGTIYFDQINATSSKVSDELRAANNVAKLAAVTPLPALGTGTVTTVSGTTIGLSAGVPEFIAGSQIDFLDATGQIIVTSLIASGGADGTSVLLQSAPAAGVVAGTAYRGAWAFDQVTILGVEVLQATTVRPALVTTDANGLLRAAEVRGGDFKLHGRVEVALVDVATATVENNSLLTHAPNTTATVSRLVINAGSMTVDATSSIDVSGKGYQDQVNGYGRTWPFTFTGGAYQSSAGSHGGEGGHSEAFAATYGSLFDPNEPGSAGGHSGNYSGNEGGGIVRIANGADAAPYNNGGGGGRIAIYAGSMSLPRASVASLGGTNGGAPGTVFFKTGSQSFGDLVVDNAGRTPTAKTRLTAVGINGVTGLTATSITNTAAQFDAPNSLTGINLIFGNDTSKSWPIVSNTATTVTVTPDVTFVPVNGALFRGLYRLDSLKARYASVQLNDLLLLGSGGPDTDGTSSVVSGNLGAPVVDLTKFSFSGATLVAATGAITDPDVPIAVTITNQRTASTWSLSIGSGVPFTVNLLGAQGDSITVRARDGHAFPLDSGDVVVGTLPVAAGVAAVTPQPATVPGGAKTTVTITLDQAAPAGGAVVALTSSNTSLAPVPATLTITAGATSASFSITTLSVATTQSITLTAAWAGTSKSSTLTVIHDTIPPSISITAPATPFAITEGQTFTLSASITDDVGVRQATAAIDGVSYPMALDPTKPNIWNATITAPDVDGTVDVPKQVNVTATDMENNLSPASTFAFNVHPIVDALAPTLTWVCGSTSMYPAGASATFSAKVTPATGDTISTVSITITGPAGPQTFPMSLVSGVYQATATIPAATDGIVLTTRIVANTFAGKSNGLPGTVTVLDVTLPTAFPFPTGGTINATDTKYEGATIIASGGTLTIAGKHTFARLAVLNGATVVQLPTTTTSTNTLDVSATAVFVACGGSIDASGRGYVGYVSGVGVTYPNTLGTPMTTGGSHGGLGVLRKCRDTTDVQPGRRHHPDRGADRADRR